MDVTPSMKAWEVYQLIFSKKADSSFPGQVSTAKTPDANNISFSVLIETWSSFASLKLAF